MEKDVKIINIDDKQIISINIPPALFSDKPIYLNGNPFSGTYLRSFEGDYKANPELIKAMFRDSSESGNDSALIEGYTFNDIDEKSLQNYINSFKSSHPEHIWNNISQKEFLKNLGGIASDRKTGKEWLTAAGLLMFGKGLSIREYYDSLQFDYLDQSNLSYGQRWSNRINIDGSWENNLFNFLSLILPQLTKDLEVPFELKGIQRIDDSPIKKAVREAVINMIIHSDYQVWGTLKVIKKIMVLSSLIQDL